MFKCFGVESTDFTWDEYFVGVAKISGMRSKDPSRQVGCCLVEKKTKRILAIGYNGFPRGCRDSDLPWGKEGKWLDTKYPYVCHAEANAILNTNACLENAVAYVTLFPCNECAKLMIQSGISEIVYTDDKDTIEKQADKRMFDLSKTKLRKFTPTYDIVCTKIL